MGGRGAGSGLTSSAILSGAKYYTVATSGNVSFVRQKATQDEQTLIRRVYKNRIYVQVSEADTLLSVSYWKLARERWVTLDVEDRARYAAAEKALIDRARRLWANALKRRNRRRTNG